jgi:hypothetical protein
VGFKFTAGDGLWKDIRSRVGKTTSMIAAVGYVGRHPMEVVRWRRGDTLIADISEQNVARGICSARGALELLRKKKVRVFQCPGLHAKVYVVDSAAIVCSANASESSMLRREAGVVLTGRDAAAARSWVTGLLARHDTVQLDEEVLVAFAKKEPRWAAAARVRAAKVTPRERRKLAGDVWLLGTQEDVDETKAEAAAASQHAANLVDAAAVDRRSDVDWFRAATSKTYSRVKTGDWVIEGWDPMKYYPAGMLAGLRRCILPVDLGPRFGHRRFRLALSDRGVSSARLSEEERAAVRKRLGLKPGGTWPGCVRVPPEAVGWIRSILRV